VEHPVTEAVAGLDLVRMQLEVARGLPLNVTQGDINLSGHAIEARLYAEDAANDFLPATGRVALWRVPAIPGLRCDSGVEEGSEVSVHYDPMLAKVIARGDTREDARLRLVRGLEALGVAGVTTNRSFLISVLEHDEFAAGNLDTHFIERHLPPRTRGQQFDAGVLRAMAIAAVIADHESRRAAAGPLPGSVPSGWRNNRWRPQDVAFTEGDRRIEVLYVARPGKRFDVETVVDGERATHEVLLADDTADGFALEIDRVRTKFAVAHEGERFFVHSGSGVADLARVPRFPIGGHEEIAGGCVAPMTGVVRKVCVSEGDRVEEGQLLLVLEAMKMEHQLVAHATGIVTRMGVTEGQMVDPDEVLVVVDAEE
jgi:acetyl/propionyl-CoA carboxylase alpha subunit